MLVLAFSIAMCLGLLVFLGKLGYVAYKREQILPDNISLVKDWPRVSVVIPARNEEQNIGTALGSMIAQTYPEDALEIIVVDDFSEDRTHEIVTSLARTTTKDIKCIMGRPLPDGWLGKSNACMAGALEARGEYIFFIDADTHSKPEMLKSVILFAMDRKIDLLSFNPRQEMISLAEKAFLPGLFMAVASHMRFDRSNNPEDDEAIANGQAMLFKKISYDKAGGHGVVSHEISEDLAFARAMKERKYKIYWAFADHLMSTRMYKNTGEIWDGFSKNMNRIMECSTPLAVGVQFLKSILAAWGNIILMIMAAWVHASTGSDLSQAALGLTLFMQLILFITYMVLASQLFLPLIYGLFVPLGLTMQAFLVINAYNLSRKKNLRWKGRKI